MDYLAYRSGDGPIPLGTLLAMFVVGPIFGAALGLLCRRLWPPPPPPDADADADIDAPKGGGGPCNDD